MQINGLKTDDISSDWLLQFAATKHTWKYQMPEAEDSSPEWSSEHKRIKIKYRSAALFHLLMAILAAHGMVYIWHFLLSQSRQQKFRPLTKQQFLNTTVD